MRKATREEIDAVYRAVKADPFIPYMDLVDVLCGASTCPTCGAAQAGSSDPAVDERARIAIDAAIDLGVVASPDGHAWYCVGQAQEARHAALLQKNERHKND